MIRRTLLRLAAGALPVACIPAECLGRAEAPATAPRALAGRAVGTLMVFMQPDDPAMPTREWMGAVEITLAADGEFLLAFYYPTGSSVFALQDDPEGVVRGGAGAQASDLVENVFAVIEHAGRPRSFRWETNA